MSESTTSQTPDGLRVSRLDRVLDQLGEQQLQIREQVRS